MIGKMGRYQIWLEAWNETVPVRVRSMGMDSLGLEGR